MRDDEHFTPADQLPAGLYERAKALADAALDVEGYTVPWVAGRSLDGKEFYPDGDLPFEVTPAKVKTRRSVKIHEMAEKLCMDDGETYDKDSDPPGEAHYHANGCEKLEVEAQGGAWEPYCLAFRPIIKDVDDETLINMPPRERWDRRPYEDDDPVLLAEIDVADKSTFTAPVAPTSGLQSYDLEGARRRRKRRRSKTQAAGAPATKESAMDEMNLFIPITKIDAAKRLVYGVATAEAPDVSGEICDYASTKPLYQKWSSQFEKATEGKSFGNLRAMHGSVAAGKLIEIAFNDDAKKIEICGKVVDDKEWAKVEEGVYTGFSQGGKYVKRWPDPDDKKLMRYTAEPIEVSLVDNPCLPSATFSVIKADGSTEMRKFKAVEGAAALTAEQIAEAAKRDGVAQAAGGEDGEWEQVWVSKRLPGKEFKNKASLRQALIDLDALEAANKTAAPVLDALAGIKDKLDKRDPAAAAGVVTVVAKKDYSDDDRKKMASEGTAMKDGSYPIANKDDLENAIQAFGRAKNKAATKRHIIKRAKALKATDLLPADWPGSTKDKDSKKSVATDLGKGADLWSISDLLLLLDGVSRMEDNAELPSWSFGNSVDLPKELCDRFGAALVELGDIAAEMLDTVLEAMKDEEAAEAVANAARARDLGKLALAKVGAKHSKSDKDHIKKAHDHLAELDPDCCPGGADEDDDAEKLAKQLAAERGANAALLNETILPAIKDLVGRLDKIDANVKSIADQPMPMGTSSVVLKVVDKTQDEFGALADKLGTVPAGSDGLARFADAVQLAAARSR